MRYYLRERIVEEMKNTGEEISLDQISKDAGVSMSILRRIYDNTGYYTSLRTLAKLADYFSCDLADLVRLRPGDEQPTEKAKLDRIMDAISKLRSELSSLMDSHRATPGEARYREIDPSASSFGNVLEETIRDVLSQSTLDGMKDKLAPRFRQPHVPVRRIPVELFIPLEISGDELRDRWLEQEITDVYEARKVLVRFLTARSVARKRLCKNLINRLTSIEKPTSLNDLVIITAGYSSVVEELLRRMKADQIEPIIAIFLGATSMTIPYEGTMMWRSIKNMGHRKVYVVSPAEFTQDGLERAIHHFLSKSIAQDNGHSIRAVFGFEGVTWDGGSIITNREYKVIIEALRSLGGNVETYCAGEAYKIMGIGEDMSFKMDDEYICNIPCALIDCLVTEHAAHARGNGDRFEVKCCRDAWKEILQDTRKVMETFG